ncbi:cytochrome P450 9e2 isoform X2 [Manduca sexta]|uniref:cytochrome P450 9e2 isoform X2 n=1 Tax=Manduca sexta TaxID=7130 RepID=UPI00118361EB|nr:cytochrome P450 9e2 isoform X2 [Manduca sexta]
MQNKCLKKTYFDWFVLTMPHLRIGSLQSTNDLKYLPGVPVFGNILLSTLGRRHNVEDMDAVYKAFPGERYVGYIEGTKPVILIRDPELMKRITIKDFEYFADRKEFFPVEIAPLLGNSMINTNGYKWREMRLNLSASFTGSKMRQMFPSMVDVSENIVSYLKSCQATPVDMVDTMRRYANDTMASAFFGIQVNSVENRNNEFYKTGKDAADFTVLDKVCYFLAVQSRLLAKVMQILGIQIFSMKQINFFRDIIANNIKLRKQNNISRPDFIHHLLDLPGDWNPDDITGQAFFAFLAGYETSSSILAICIHELALNPDIQERLYQEIRASADVHKELNYDTLASLKYLDCYLNEINRKWAAAIVMDRICTRTYELPPPREGGKPYKVMPGQLVYNVVNPVHMDPKYHVNPEVLDPDRFSDENRPNIKQFTFLPFGMGPRRCLGLQFATMQMKLILYQMVLNFEIQKCEMTTDPIRMYPSVLIIKSIGGTWVRIRHRLRT